VLGFCPPTTTTKRKEKKKEKKKERKKTGRTPPIIGGMEVFSFLWDNALRYLALP